MGEMNTIFAWSFLSFDRMFILGAATGFDRKATSMDLYEKKYKINAKTECAREGDYRV